ncbi:hypothetical protein BGW80DRAFT_819954 [Lactifluus volemus]|nr:hypothetical protein BGW80DRAFT_819954 [Lactifluus volemus]
MPLRGRFLRISKTLQTSKATLCTTSTLAARIERTSLGVYRFRVCRSPLRKPVPLTRVRVPHSSSRTLWTRRWNTTCRRVQSHEPLPHSYRRCRILCTRASQPCLEPPPPPHMEYTNDSDHSRHCQNSGTLSTAKAGRPFHLRSRSDDTKQLHQTLRSSPSHSHSHSPSPRLHRPFSSTPAMLPPLLS